MQCDLIIKGKYILPMDSDFTIINNGMVVVDNNHRKGGTSKIVAVGSEKELSNKHRAPEIIDAGNSIVMPGLINTHTHAAMTYFRGLADDLPLAEWWEKYLFPAEKNNLNPDFIRKASELACLEMVKSGTTCFNDMYYFQDITAEIALKAGIRVMAGEGILSFSTPSCETPDLAINKTLKFINKFKDSELVNVAFAPHSIYTCSKDILINVKELADKYKALIHIHVSETKKEILDSKKEHGKSPVAYLDELGLLGENIIAAHSVWLDKDDLEIYRKRNVKVSHCPISNMKLASGIMPVAEMLDKGIVVGLGTDGAASNNTLDLFSDMRVCALLHKVNQLEPTIINAREVVRMATINGARVLGLEDKIGSLEVGKRADIITINLDKPHLLPIYDPYSHIVYCVNRGDVSEVVINGQIIMRNREVNKIDEEKVLREASNFKRIKGVGMTMLAQYLEEKGVEIFGSDTEEIFMTDKVLKKVGIKVIEKFSASNITEDADLIIYSSAYNAEQNEEVAKALKSKIKTLTYAQALGEVFNQKFGVAVVGSHGKTTITAWLGYVLEKAGLKPSVMVGASVPQFNGLSLVGPSDYLVVELDEYQNKLKYFQPKGVLLNNIDYDHPDFFSSEEEYRDVFLEFIKKIPAQGFLVCNFDDEIIRKIANVNCRGKVITYAIDEVADFIAYDIKQMGNKQYFKVKLAVPDEDDTEFSETDLGNFSTKLMGKHNIYNALAVIATGVELGIDLVDIRKYLEEFEGTMRRMQVLGQFKGATIIDDYAHHPTEIKTTIATARQLYKDKKLIVVFHPHTFTRTKVFLDDFAESFLKADEVIVLDIYGSAREKQGGVHSRELAEKISKNLEVRSKKISYIPTLNDCEKYLRENVERGDVVLLMGAGDVFRIGENLVK
jgi:5-methylthioadenosine/S-adenosylhomocysteine deaminase